MWASDASARGGARGASRRGRRGGGGGGEREKRRACVRLAILDRGHTLGKKAILAMIRMVSRQPPQDVVKTMLYRPEFLGGPLGQMVHEVMRGSSEWSV